MSSLAPIRWLSQAPQHTRGLRALQICIGLVLTFRVATEIPFASYLWGPQGVSDASVTGPLGAAVGGVFDALFATALGPYLVLLAVALAGFALIWGVSTRAACLIALAAFSALEFRMSALGDGGDNVIRIVLAYLVLTVPAGREARAGSLAAWFHNVGVVAIVAQVCVLYATSGLMKTYGEMWHQGTAMYYISQVEWISLPALRDAFKIPIVTTIATYVPMLFMVTFPIAIFSRLKVWYVAIGLSLHLGIAVMMGLLTFSTAMIGLELFLLNDTEYARLDGVLRAARVQLAQRWAAVRRSAPRPLATADRVVVSHPVAEAGHAR